MPKVYVTQEVPTANYKTAEKYGDIVFLCTTEISQAAGSLHNVKLVNNIRERFKKFDPLIDYIAPSGSPVITCIVMAIAREKGSTFNFLKWNNREHDYAPVTINVEGDNYVY